MADGDSTTADAMIPIDCFRDSEFLDILTNVVSFFADVISVFAVKLQTELVKSNIHPCIPTALRDLQVYEYTAIEISGYRDWVWNTRLYIDVEGMSVHLHFDFFLVTCLISFSSGF